MALHKIAFRAKIDVKIVILYTYIPYSYDNFHSRKSKESKMELKKTGHCNMLLLLGVDVYRLGMSLSRPLAAPSTTVLSLAMSLAAARHAAT